MMDCTDYRILISGHIDGELTDQEMRQLKDHLQECEACLAHLQHLETLQMTLKRFALLQDAPEIPRDFASAITNRIQQTVAERRPSVLERLREKSRKAVTPFAEWWAESLLQRPVVWTTSLSLCIVMLAALLTVNAFRATLSNRSFQYDVEVVPTASQVAQREPLPMPASTPDSTARSLRSAPVAVKAAPTVVSEEEAGNAMLRFSDEPAIVIGEAEYSPPQIVEASEGDLWKEVESSSQTERTFVQVAQHKSTELEDYVYAHVLEAVQDQLVDDAVFFGYVHNVASE